MSNSAAESLAHQESYSGASKKVKRKESQAHQAHQESQAHQRNVQAHQRKFIRAHPRKLFGRIQAVWYILLIKVKPHKKLQRYKSSRIRNCEDTSKAA
jgi:hypothetical protein